MIPLAIVLLTLAPPSWADLEPPQFSDEDVARMQRLAHAMIGGADGEEGPLTKAEMRLVMTTAAVSSLAEWCGLDWQQRSFLPLMSRFRSSGRYSEEQLTAVSVSHGIVQGSVASQLKESRCTDRMRRDIEAYLDAQ